MNTKHNPHEWKDNYFLSAARGQEFVMDGTSAVMDWVKSIFNIKWNYMDTTIELIPKENDRIICVKVGKVMRENLYEMTRKYWVVKLQRASKATHVFAIVDGIVEAVFIPREWKYTEDFHYEGRCEFIGIEDPDSKYLGKSVKAFYGHSANPVKYINM